MVLNVDLDAVYSMLPHAMNRLVGHFFLNSTLSLTRTVQPNGPILTECKTICHLVSNDADAETAAIFHNSQTASVQHILTELGHLQPPTPIKTDNATANALSTRQ